MDEAAKADAAEADVSLTLATGKKDGDTDSQIQAIENAISRGDRGILITPNGTPVPQDVLVTFDPNARPAVMPPRARLS